MHGTNDTPRLVADSLTAAEKLSMTFRRFAAFSAAGGVVLIAITAVAMLWANSPWAETYSTIFGSTPLRVTLGEFGWTASLRDWINDALMAVFFFMIGLEIKREVLFGELSSIKRAALPLIAAVGGMAVPGAIYAVINKGGDGMHGWGIPTATDIAFALGVMTLLGSRVPAGLKVFLTTLAVADDLGALIVIALFYTDSPSVSNILIAFAALAVMYGMNKSGVRSSGLYLLVGAVVWWFIHHSGVHATIAGVLTAMTIPSESRADIRAFATFTGSTVKGLESQATASTAPLSGEQQERIGAIEEACERAQSPLQRLEHALVPWCGFFIIPIFALANAGVPLSTGDVALGDIVRYPECLGVTLGLTLGKPIGIFLASFIAVKLGLGALPSGVNFKHIHGAAWLGGIGFTMSLFIAGLAFKSNGEVGVLQLNAAKLGILGGSSVAAILGLIILTLATRSKSPS
ncbi:MAG: Na+/H+ antiporter NhaA [Phycisphaerales bacterium]